MNAPTTIPVRVVDPWSRALDLIDEAREERVWRPQGHDAPKHSVAWSNFEAARIAAREVRGKAIHCPRHRASLEAWERGERSWPWPDSDGAQADEAVRGLLSDDELVRNSKAQNMLRRQRL